MKTHTKAIYLIIISLVLTNCAGGFPNHWNKETPRQNLSWAGKSYTFKVLEEGSGSKKVNYNYSKIALGFDKYESYAEKAETVEDTLTGAIISKRMREMGFSEAENSQLEIAYVQLLGWDMGEIVKAMKVCVAAQNSCDCAGFSELTMFNTHPTRTRVVGELLSILMTKEIPVGARNEKYNKWSCLEE